MGSSKQSPNISWQWFTMNAKNPSIRRVWVGHRAMSRCGTTAQHGTRRSTTMMGIVDTCTASRLRDVHYQAQLNLRIVRARDQTQPIGRSPHKRVRLWTNVQIAHHRMGILPLVDWRWFRRCYNLFCSFGLNRLCIRKSPINTIVYNLIALKYRWKKFE